MEIAVESQEELWGSSGAWEARDSPHGSLRRKQISTRTYICVPSSAREQPSSVTVGEAPLPAELVYRCREHRLS